MDLALLLAVLLGGTALTYLLPLAVPLLPRLAAGFCLGTVLMALTGLVLGPWLGLGPAALALAALVALLPAGLVAARPLLRARALASLAEARATLSAARQQPLKSLVALASAAALGALLFRAFTMGCFQDERGLQTADVHNLGDLPFHLAVLEGFARGQNFPPQHPELAGTRLTYPFLVDLAAAQLVRAGAPPTRALVEHDLALGLALAALLAFFARRFTGDRLAALITPWLVFLSGGFGFLLLLGDLDPLQGGIVGLLPHLPADYTIRDAAGLRFGNALTTLLVTQRSLLLGAPLFLATAALWWHAVSGPREEARPYLRAAGVVVGLLPLVHGHSFAAALAVGTALALLFPGRGFGMFLRTALMLAAPQVLWLGSSSSMQPGRFVAWHPGWDHGSSNPAFFWLWNAGVFIPLLLAALLWPAHAAGWRPWSFWRQGRFLSAKQLAFYLPLACCFVVPNLLRLSPWIWDNIKFLFLWWAASAPLVALVLARLLRGRAGAALFGLLLLGAALLSGALDVWRLARPVRTYVIFGPSALDLAETVAALLPPQALVLHAPAYDSPVPLSGRRSLLGYEGHIWSQGLDAGARADRIRQLYGGLPQGDLKRGDVDAVLVGPQERQAYTVNEAFFADWPVLADTPPYRLYRVP